VEAAAPIPSEFLITVAAMDAGTVVASKFAVAMVRLPTLQAPAEFPDILSYQVRLLYLLEM
jgi:hypothetical protein